MNTSPFSRISACLSTAPCQAVTAAFVRAISSSSSSKMFPSVGACAPILATC
jgi:hypothetical protein